MQLLRHCCAGLSSDPVVIIYLLLVVLIVVVLVEVVVLLRIVFKRNGAPEAQARLKPKNTHFLIKTLLESS